MMASPSSAVLQRRQLVLLLLLVWSVAIALTIALTRGPASVDVACVVVLVDPTGRTVEAPAITCPSSCVRHGPYCLVPAPSSVNASPSRKDSAR